MKTIRKNSTKKIEEILKKFDYGFYYTLDNGFIGEKVKLNSKRLQNDIESGMCKLQDHGNEKFHITYHSNLWIELR